MKSLLIIVLLFSHIFVPAYAKNCTSFLKNASLKSLFTGSEVSRIEMTDAELLIFLTEVIPDGSFVFDGLKSQDVVLTATSNVNKTSTLSSFFHIAMYDPSHSRPRLFGGSTNHTRVTFNVFDDLVGQSTIIRRTDPIRRMVTILIERAELAQQYDRGSRYQEIKLIFNELNRLKEITISNGNFASLRYIKDWKSHTVFVPEGIVIGQKAVFLLEDGPYFETEF